MIIAPVILLEALIFVVVLSAPSLLGATVATSIILILLMANVFVPARKEADAGLTGLTNGRSPLAADAPAVDRVAASIPALELPEEIFSDIPEDIPVEARVEMVEALPFEHLPKKLSERPTPLAASITRVAGACPLERLATPG